MIIQVTFNTIASGYIEYEFESNGWLKSLRITDDLTLQQRTWIVRHTPVNKEEFDQLIEHLNKTGKKPTVTQVHKEADFRDFYWNYPVKKNKQRAIKLWNSMSGVARRRAIDYLPKYLRSVQPNTTILPMYPDNYLYKKPWEDEIVETF